MIRYFDASAWAKRHLSEPGSPEVLQLGQRASVATSRLTVVETASGILRNLREGRVAALACDAMLGVWLLEVDEIVCRLAIEVLRRHALRAGDAIQLASALDLRQRMTGPVEFVCFDQRLNAAARSEGLLTPSAS